MLLNQAFGKSKKAGKNFFKDLRQMGTDIFGGIGIGGAVPRDEATDEVLTNYATETFGPHLEEIEELDFTDEYEGPWPHEGMPSEDVEVIDKPLPVISDELWDSIRDFDLGTIGGGGKLHAGESIEVDPWLLDPSLPMPPELIEGEKYLPGNYYDKIIEEEVPAPIPSFNDSGRESGIASMMKSGLNVAGRRPYEDEYRAFVESSGPSTVTVTYEDFMENYLPRIQESRGVLRAPLNSQGRR